ncbi:S-layer protein [Aerosakkonema sp. BLCC-F183]|uniref:S-layer protein n=2 Tax=Aerosakkonema TaxID=1246629 RepID=UPI0035BC1D56
MQLKMFAFAAILAPLCLANIAQAQNSQSIRSDRQTAQARPTAEQVLNACVQNRADTLPIPFTDVSPNDWAFKAVMNLYYCGAIGPNTPPEVIEKLRNNAQKRSVLPSTDMTF